LQHVYEFALRALPWPQPIIHDVNLPPGSFHLPEKSDDAEDIQRWINEAVHESVGVPELLLSDYDRADHSDPVPTNLPEYSDYFLMNGYFDDRSEDKSSKPQCDQSIVSAGENVVSGEETVQSSTQYGTGISYEDISRDLVNYQPMGRSILEDYPIFFPKNKIEALVQSDRVKSTLREIFEDITDKDVKELEEYVMTHAKRVFLTLVLSRTVKYIKKLSSADVKDKTLPVSIHQGRQVCEMTSAILLDGFANWKTDDIERFCQKQWIFLAPVFQQGEFSYTFRVDQPLPFIPAKVPATGSEHYGIVRRFQLHPAHYQKESNVSFLFSRVEV
jgi:hypothetical protein